MRVITQITHDTLGITLFAWNQKYILKFELGNLEQTYKVHELDTAGEADIKRLATDEAFLAKVMTRFEVMQGDWEEVLG